MFLSGVFYCESLSTEPKKETKEETLSEIHQAWEFCNERSRSVEVCYRNMDDVKIITRVHFQFDPVVSTVYVLSLLLVCVCVCVCFTCVGMSLHMYVLYMYLCCMFMCDCLHRSTLCTIHIRYVVYS